jgi:uncharacterized protein (TIGR03067 family)
LTCHELEARIGDAEKWYNTKVRPLLPLSVTQLLFILALTLTCVSSSANEVAPALIARWTMTGWSNKPLDTARFQIEWKFTPDEVIVRDLKRNKEVSRNRYTVDTTKYPAWITVTIAGPAPETRLGIFRIRGNELHLKQQIGVGERPTDFGESYTVLRRVETTKRDPIR